MSCGIPVVASPLPSTGGAALDVVPTDVGAIADALVVAAGDERTRAELVDRGRRRAGQLTWTEAARRHVELWSSVLT
jgi:alpha-1,3-rhamnosyl/mannosyltransferase